MALIVLNSRPTHTTPMYDMNLFLVPDDEPKTDTASTSIWSLMLCTTDSIGMPAPQLHNYSNYNGTMMI